MQTFKTYKFKLRLNNKQKLYFDKCISHCRCLYNVAKETREWAWRSYGLTLNRFSLSKEIPKLKEQEPWLKEVSSQSLDDVLERLEKAFSNFFSGKSSYPNWAKKGKYNSITFKTVKKHTHNRVILPKIGSVKYFASSNLDGELRRATVIKELDGYYISILTKKDVSINNFPICENQAIGLDVGVSYFVVTSSGQYIKNPAFIKDFLAKLRREQRSLSRKKKFSINWNKQRQKIGRLQLKIKRKRLDFLHKVSTEIVNSSNQIFVENLKLKNMTKSAKGTIGNPGVNVKQKRSLNRSMIDLGIGIFFNQLEYKSAWQGKSFSKVDPKYTSQICSECGHASKENRKSQSDFCCQSCGYSTNADYNASLNILKRGLGKSSSRKRVALARS